MTVSTQLPRDILVSADIYWALGTAGKQNYASSPDAQVTGGLMPMSLHKRALLGDPLMTHVLIVDDNADVRPASKVVIGTVSYRCAHVDTHDYGGHPHKQCILARVDTSVS